MTFFYDLNKKLDEIRATPELKHGQLNERDMSRAAKGYEKYGKEGMQALAKAGRDGKALDPVRKKYDKYDESVEEGMGDMARKVGGMVKKVAGKAMDTVGHGSDADMIRDLQRKMGMPQTGMKPGDEPNPKQIKEKMSPAKAKSFAALAEPKDKITFADKIAGAKKEVDEMLGDVAAEAMRNALGGKKVMADEGNDFTGARLAAIRAGKPTFKVAGKTYRVSGDTSDEKSMVEADREDLNPFTNYKKPRADRPKVGSTEHGALHDIEHTATGRKVTRRVDPNTGHSVGADDDTPGEKRGRGRPAGKGAGKSIGAKGPSGKSKLMTREGPDDIEDQGEYDQEGDMALDDINTIESAANELQSIIDADDNLPEWVQSKINKAMDYLDTARDYMSAQQDDEQIVEKAVSKKQQKFMGMVHATQKGEKAPSKEVAKVAKSMGKKDAEDFASTKHKGLPNKVKEESTDKEDQKAEKAGKRVAKDIEHDEGHKGRDDNRAERAGKKVTKDVEYDDKKDRKEKKKDEVEENTVAGSVAPAMGGSAPKGKGGMTFGKGVYEGAIAESFNSKLKSILNEGMSVNMSADQDGKKSLTVTATDDDAVKLSQLLNLAGIGGQSQGYGTVCPSCGSSDCGCDHVDEDLANSAENTEYADTNYMVNGLSGGLNGRKTDQSTLPVLNRDPRRTVGSVAESNDVVELYKRIA
jgi:hypothetical protein